MPPWATAISVAKESTRAAIVGYDYEAKAAQFAGAQANYNWDCCGVTFEYRRWNLGSGS